MAKSRYIDHIEKILEMRYCDEKKWIEIVRYLNMNSDIKATENSLIIFTRRYIVKNKWTDFNVFLMTATNDEVERARRGDVPPETVENLSAAINYLDEVIVARKAEAKRKNIPYESIG